MSKPDNDPPTSSLSNDDIVSRLAAFDWCAGLYNGTELTRDQIAAELHDYRHMLSEVPKVYMHVTGGLLSKPNYFADGVIAAADDHMTRTLGEEVGDAITDGRCWRPIADHDGSEDPVDLWRDGERLIEWKLIKGGWQKVHGYPTVTTRLTTPPSHFMPSAGAPE